MKTESLWQATPGPRFAKLAGPAEFDVVIIGGGITGMTAAYLLKEAGKRVAVLERDRIGGVDTGFTTAHLTYVTDMRLKDIVKRFGEDGARLTWSAGEIAIDTVESIVGEEEIDCAFQRVPGYLHAKLYGTKDETDQLQKDAELAKQLGFHADLVPTTPWLKVPAVRFANQAKFHPLRYLSGLAERVHGGGSAIHENSEVTEVKEDPLRVVVGKHEVRCEYLVIATHVPLMGKTGLVSATLFQTKIYPYSSYVIGATLPKGRLPEACFWDTSDPYYYLRVEAGKRSNYVIFGGKDHKTGQETNTEERFQELAQTLVEFLPEAKPERRWSGQVIETSDGLPYMGETAKGQFAASGYSGNGMTFGTIAGMMARDAALGRSNPWHQLFSVDRKAVRGAWEYVKENLDFPYYFVRDRLAGTEGDSTRDVRRGEGKVITLEGLRVACSRDEEGKLSAVSAVCTHLGCLVRWNGAEQTWDCPCHGSRFRPNGEVLAGPAEEPLEAVELSVNRKTATGRNGTGQGRGSGGRRAGPRSAGQRSRRK